MAGTVLLLDNEEQRISVAIDPAGNQLLGVSRRRSFDPDLIARSAEISTRACFQSSLQGLGRAVRLHQYLPASVLDNCRHQPFAEIYASGHGLDRVDYSFI